LALSNTVIETAKPPLNLFEVTRMELQGDDYFTILEVPRWKIRANGPIPESFVNTAAIMTGLTITNQHTSDITVSARIVGTDAHTYKVLNSAPVPPNDFLLISFDRQVMLTGEKLEIACDSNTASPSANHATVHFTYIINQREQYPEY
jgi:hypothetical protein